MFTYLEKKMDDDVSFHVHAFPVDLLIDVCEVLAAGVCAYKKEGGSLLSSLSLHIGNASSMGPRWIPIYFGLLFVASVSSYFVPFPHLSEW